LFLQVIVGHIAKRVKANNPLVNFASFSVVPHLEELSGDTFHALNYCKFLGSGVAVEILCVLSIQQGNSELHRISIIKLCILVQPQGLKIGSELADVCACDLDNGILFYTFDHFYKKTWESVADNL
jgi:hypothetical protein